MPVDANELMPVNGAVLDCSSTTIHQYPVESVRYIDESLVPSNACTGMQTTSKQNKSIVYVPSTTAVHKLLSVVGQKNRRKWFANPKFALICGMIEIGGLILVLTTLNIIEGSFFRFGPPVQLFQYTITGQKEFVGIMTVFFVHQVVFTWLNEVVAPWILNEVQDSNVHVISFSKSQTLVLINVYYAYYTLNSVLLVNFSLSQLSFLCVMLLADFIATTTLNLHYIWHKKGPNDIVESQYVEMA